MSVPPLAGEGVSLRPLTPGDLASCHALFQEIGWDDPNLSVAQALDRRRDWLDWSLRNRMQLQALNQPPYGDMVICDQGGRFAGLIGIVPRLEPFGRLPSFGGDLAAANSAEVGLFWVLRPASQGRGLATRAARLLSGWMFESLGLQRIAAGTDYDNAASIAVMGRLGMRIEHNPLADPPWFQVTGTLETPRPRPDDGAALVP